MDTPDEVQPVVVVDPTPVADTPLVPLPLHHQPVLDAVTINIFIYFVCDLREAPSIVVDGGIMVYGSNIQFQDHGLWAEFNVPARKEFRFYLKVGRTKENGANFHTRTIKSEYVQEGMLYVDFNSELFDSSYFSNTVRWIDSTIPFQNSALLLACRCTPVIFEREINFLFGKMKDKTRYSLNLHLDLTEFFERVTALVVDGPMKEDVFVKGVILGQICAKHRIQVLQYKGFSLDIIKNALPSLERSPQYISMAEEVGLHHGGGREAVGLFFLVSALALDFNNKKQDASKYVRSFKHHTSTSFTESEVQVLSSVDWKRYPTLSPQGLCGCIAAADQINQRDAVIPFLLGHGLTEYWAVLGKMKYEEYMLV